MEGIFGAGYNSSVGLVIYIWIFFAVAAIIAAIVGIRWAKATGQFDESVKYQIFNEPDDEVFHMTDAEIDEAVRQAETLKANAPGGEGEAKES